MSYIQIEIGGKLRGLKFNNGAVMLMNEKQAIGTFAFTGDAMVYAGLFANAYVKGVEFVDEVDTGKVDEKGKKIIQEIPITLEMVSDWVDELDESVMNSVIACFQQTQAFKKVLKKEDPEPESEEDKKKLEATIKPIVTESPVDT